MADGTLKFDTKVDNSGVTTGLSALKGIFAVGMAAIVAKQAIGLAKMGIAYNSQMADFRSKFKVMLGSTEKATQHLNQLRKMAVTTPFRTTDLAEASQQLLAFGVNAKDVKGHLQRLGDISLGNKEKFQSLGLVLGQVSSQGKLMGQDLLQFINAGFNPLKELEKMGRGTYAELKEQMAQGKISFQDVQAAMEHATSKGGMFFNGMKEGSKTFAAQVDALKGNLQILAGKAVEPLYNLLTKIIPKLTASVSWLNKHPAVIKAITAAVVGLTGAMTAYYASQKWGMISNIVGSSMSKSIKFMRGFHDSMWLNLGVGADKIIPGFGDKILKIPLGVQGAVSKMQSALMSGISSLKAFALSPAGLAVAFGAATLALGHWVKKVGGVDKAQEIITKKLEDFKAKVPEFVRGIGAAFRAGIKIIGQIAKEILPEIGKAIVDNLPGALTLIGNMMAKLGDWLSESASKLGDFLAEGIPKAVNKIYKAIPGFFKSLISGLGAGAGEAGKNAGKAVGDKAGSSVAVTVIKALVKGLWKMSKALILAMPEILLGLVKGIIMSIPAAVGAIFELAKEIWNALNAGLDSLVQVAINWLAGFIPGINAAATSVLQSVWNFAKSLPGKIVSGIGSLVSTAGQWIWGFATGAVATAASVIQTIWSFAVQLPGRVVSGIGSLVHTAVKWLAGFISGLGQGFSRAISSAASYAASIPGRIRAGLGNLFQIGVDFLAGLINGIKKGFDKALSLIGSLGKKCKDKLKDVFDIHSPSRFTLWIGRMLMRGLGVGIDGGVGAVLTTLGAKMQLVKDALVPDPAQFDPIDVWPTPPSTPWPSWGQPAGGAAPITVHQEVNINQPVSSPIDTAREIKKQAITLGLAGV